MHTLEPMLLLALLLGCSWFLVVWALGHQMRVKVDWQRSTSREVERGRAQERERKGNIASIAFFVAMTVVAVTAIWIGRADGHLPRWFLWLTTVL